MERNQENQDGNPTEYYVNARQHVRPRRYRRRLKKARLHVDHNDDKLSDNGFSTLSKDDPKNDSDSTIVDLSKDPNSENSAYSGASANQLNENKSVTNTNNGMTCTLLEKETSKDDVMNYLNNDSEDNFNSSPVASPLPDQPVDMSVNCGNREDDLIHFIKQQESTLLDSLLADLEPNTGKEDFEENEDTTANVHRERKEDDAPVQPGHWLTLKTSVLLIWIFAITHSLTSSQLKDLLTLINLLLLQSNPAFESLYRFKTYFSNLEMPARKHYYCASCYSPADVEQHSCANPTCRKDLTKVNNKEYFLELDILSQLKTFYAREEFEEGLKHKFSRVKKRNDSIEDVYDSQQYQNLCVNDGPLSKPYNVSFVFNTDGVPIFKSSKTSIWPIFLIINELPYKMRKSRKYMILAGLWCGSAKPSMNIFLEPMLKALSELEKGVEVTTYSGKTVNIKGFLLAISCDLPARSAVLNINQHNGEGCCIKCLQLGKNHRTQTGGNIRVFEYKKGDPSGPCRTHESIMQDAQNITDMNKKATSHINGIKGPSVVMFCPQVDGVKSVAIDYMHLVCLGTVRLLLKLWFNVSHSLNNFSLYRYTEIVDSRLEEIKPPHLISRQPRSISEHMKFWKASELRSWFFITRFHVLLIFYHHYFVSLLRIC
ncbi:uncharacterized protein LOC128552724 [Mercenaria mercenaria]|uniref:uncharacterized protein LOC128552724 n=1 Tax=Mercenaria mercenaria TaxID=6596 RepID=UPI00234F81CA|nr:uncharacterized protein LOC128552724 [Mercenaria mercenaria]